MMHRQVRFPVIRFVGLVWLAVWIPITARAYGWVNFLHECDVAVILTVIGLWYSNALLLSASAVGVLIPDALWCVDGAWQLFVGHHLIGGTEYMWDPQIPLAARLLSLFHVVLPILLVWAVARTGYDRRAAATQFGIFAVLLAASRFASPSLNINFAYFDPILHRSWGTAPEHCAVILCGAIVAFAPAHWMFRRYFPAAETPADSRAHMHSAA